ncbi:MAG: TolC family protein [Elusimicrobia bacterium]|nr:TolC family protein [Elusimicrobiota bacterium]
MTSVGAEEKSTTGLSVLIEKALTDNAALMLAQDELGIARARQRVATMAVLPALTGKLDESRGKADNSGDENQDFLERSYGLQATQTLFSGGKVWGTRRQSVFATEIANLQLEKQRLDVRHAVTEAYWRVAALQRALAIHKANHKTLQEDLEKAVRHELSEARTARIELLSTRAQNRESETAIAELEEDLMEARVALLDAMGQRVPMDFAVPEELPTGQAAVDEGDALRVAKSNRPDIRIADRMIESARVGRAIGRSGLFPKVDLNGFYGRSGAALCRAKVFPTKIGTPGFSVGWAWGEHGKILRLPRTDQPQIGRIQPDQNQQQQRQHFLGRRAGDGRDQPGKPKILSRRGMAL